MCAHVRKTLADLSSQDVAEATRIQYGVVLNQIILKNIWLNQILMVH